MDASNQGVSKEGHRFSLVTYEPRWQHVWRCTVCGHTRVGDGSHIIALDEHGEPFQSPEKNAEHLLAQCPGHPKIRKFFVSTERDLDAFAAAMAETVIRATPLGWPIIRAQFQQLVEMSRLTVRLGVGDAAAYYIVEADDRVLWEEDDSFESRSHSIVMQIPRDRPLRRMHYESSHRT
jgi:hypothetical protein